MHADLVVTGGRIYTGALAQPWVESLAVGGGVLLAVGPEAGDFLGPDTKVVELKGAFVMTGLIDVHNHHALAGKTDLFELSFSPAASYEQILQAVRDRAAGLSPDAWITGGSWGSTLLGELSHESAQQGLDEAAGGRPVMLTDDSHHNRWVSSRAMELAGLTAESEVPAGGVVVLDADTGMACGVLLEAAGIAVEQAMARTQRLTAEQHVASSRRGIEILHGHGVTAFQDAATSLEMLQSLKALDDAGELTAWVVSSMTVNDSIFGFDPVGQPLIARGEEFRTRHHRPDFVKIFLDGVPPARTGAFLAPYRFDELHGAHFCGSTTMPADELEDWLRRTAERGLSAKIHCTGDAAVRMVLDTVEGIRNEGFDAPKYQVAHGQFVDADDIGRFAPLGVSADISPFLWFPGEIPNALAAVLEDDVVVACQPNRKLIDAGALVAGGSDWPVSESPNLLEGIEGLVTRADPSGRAPGTLGLDQALTREEAVAVFTLNAARAMGLGDVTGSLEVGKSADFIVLDRDIFAGPVEEIATAQVRQTWFAGTQVYEQPGSTSAS